MAFSKALVVGFCFTMSMAFSGTLPTVSARLGEILPGGSSDVSVSFVSDDALVLLVHAGGARDDHEARLFLVKLAGKALSIRADMKMARDASQAYLVSEGRIIVQGSRESILLSANISGAQKLPIKKLVEPFSGSNVVGVFTVNEGWRAVRLDTVFSLAKEGPGRLESLSDEIVVYRLKDEIISESFSGRRLGSFSVPSDAGDSRIVEVAGSNRLYLDIRGREGIVDLDGKSERKFRTQEGWGFRHGWSNHGERMLFDRYKRTIPISQKVMESLITFATLGLGAPDQPANGEEITVLDTRSGRVCFHFDSPTKLLGDAGSMHASISPSGRWVAIATTADLSIYPLPENCSIN